MAVHKVVLQIPYDEDAAEIVLEQRWQESSNPHGPHIKVYPDERDAETGERCIIVRCKHRSLDEVDALARKVTTALREEM